MDNIVNAPGPMIIIPDTGKLQARKHISLPILRIFSPAATINTIIPGFNSSYMLSLGQLYDNGCNVLLNKQKMYAIKEKGVVIEGERNHRGGLLDIILPSNPNDKKVYKLTITPQLLENCVKSFISNQNSIPSTKY